MTAWGKRWITRSILVIVVPIALWFSPTGIAKGAVVLDYFAVISDSAGVTLEWATLAEFNVAGFNIYFKEVEAPPSGYSIVGTELAQGGPEHGYLYTFPIDTLESAVVYCFRVEEITTDGSTPEAYDRCGYGIDLTPTPTPSIEPVPITPIPATPPLRITAVFESPLATPTAARPSSGPIEVAEPITVLLFGGGIALGALLLRGRKQK